MASFQIPDIPPTTNKSIRIPNNLVEGIENAIRGKIVPLPNLSLPLSGLPCVIYKRKKIKRAHRNFMRENGCRDAG